MHLILDRLRTSDQGTFGRLTVEGKVFFTGELPWRDNISKLSCIPAGVYPCRWVKSGRYGHIYGVFETEGRIDIRIHNGNYCGDTTLGWKSHVLGCILVGYARGTLAGQQAILNSRPALTDFNAMLAEQPFTLEVRNNGLW